MYASLITSHLSYIEWVVSEFLSLFVCHYLYFHGPAGEVFVGDGIKQISDSVVRVGSSKLICFTGWQVLNSLISLKIETQRKYFTDIHFKLNISVMVMDKSLNKFCSQPVQRQNNLIL